MRKIFRFKYEPCTGRCYAWCKFLPKELRRLVQTERQSLVSDMVDAHARLCDNQDYSFGVDVDETMGVFVAHFHSPEETTLYSGREFKDVVNQVCKKVMSTEIPKVAANCIYGDNGAENLGVEILQACTDAVFNTLENNTCACQV